VHGLELFVKEGILSTFDWHGFRAIASKSADPFNANDARGAKGTQTPIRTALFSRRGAGARRTLHAAMRRDASGVEFRAPRVRVAGTIV
jgi:hypothetical protein